MASGRTLAGYRGSRPKAGIIRQYFAPLIALLIFTFPLCASAHDIPNDVTVQIFLKPAGDQLRVIVRVPLAAMRDIDFPARPDGFLDFSRADDALREAVTTWISHAILLYEGNAQLPSPAIAAVHLSLQSDRSFDSYDDALSHVTGPNLAQSTSVYWDQTMLDALLDYPIHSAQSNFSIRPGELGRLAQRVLTVLRFVPPDGSVRAFEFEGDPGLVHLDPSWFQASLRFVGMGFLHILDGTDHLLFLFCLVIPFRKIRSLIPVITAFTVAHSCTLLASAYNLAPSALWFPPLIEMLIAISIVYMALENIVGGSNVKRRWITAFGFGLVHGFGFSFVLRQTLQFAGTHLLTSLLSFNLGVELGQLLVLLLFIPALELLFRFVVAERMGTMILSAIVAHTAWHWMLDRASILRQYRLQWPVLSAAALVSAIHWVMVIVMLAGLYWLVPLAWNYLAGRGGTALRSQRASVVALGPAEPNGAAASAKPNA
jgi:hypothetical protein